MKSLRRLRPPQVRAVDCFADYSVLHPLDRVAERQRRDRGRRAVEGVEHPVDQPVAGKRPRAVMDQHAGRVVWDEGLQPEAHRILPLRSSRNRRQQRQPGDCRVEDSAVLAADHDLHAGDARMPRERRDRVAQHGAGAERQVLLGHGAAKPGAAAGGDDKGKNRTHFGNLDRAMPACQRAARHR